MLFAGDRNCSIRYPLEAWISTPSRPPSRHRLAALANASIISSIIGIVISIGVPPTRGFGMALAETWVVPFPGARAEPG